MSYDMYYQSFIKANSPANSTPAFQAMFSFFILAVSSPYLYIQSITRPRSINKLGKHLSEQETVLILAAWFPAHQCLFIIYIVLKITKGDLRYNEPRYKKTNKTVRHEDPDKHRPGRTFVATYT